MANKYPFNISMSALDRFSATFKKLEGGLDSIKKRTTAASNAFTTMQMRTEKLTRKLDSMSSKMQRIGTKATLGMTVPLTLAGRAGVKAFAGYETALVGLGKTTDLSKKDLQSLGKEFRQMAKEVPVPVEQLLELGQTAAQLGVKGNKDIKTFTKTMAMLSKSSDVAGEEGATQLARFISVTGESVTEADKFASTLVHLGNNFELREAELLHFTQRLGASTAVFEIGGVKAMGLAAAMKSLGIQSEAGSSAVQRAMGALNKAINKGGAQLSTLTKLTGKSGAELKKAFKEDAAGVFRDFVKGMSEAEDKGAELTEVMAHFGLSGVRDIAVVGTLTKQVDKLDEVMAASHKAFKENNALQKEYADAINTTNSRFQLFKNRLNDAAITMGEKLAPKLEIVLDKIVGLAEWIANLSDSQLEWIIGIGTALAVLGPLAIVLSSVLTSISLLVKGVSALAGVFAFLGKLKILAALGKVGVVIAGITAPVWATVAAVTALVAGLANLYLRWEKISNAFSKGGLIEGAKSFFGFGDKKFEQPTGPDMAGAGVMQKSEEGKARDSMAWLSVDFSNVPQGTKTKISGESSFLEFKAGMAGGPL